MPTRNKASRRFQRAAALLGRVDIWTYIGWASNRCFRIFLPRQPKLSKESFHLKHTKSFRRFRTCLSMAQKGGALMPQLENFWEFSIDGGILTLPGCCGTFGHFPVGNCSEGWNCDLITTWPRLQWFGIFEMSRSQFECINASAGISVLIMLLCMELCGESFVSRKSAEVS